MAYCVPAVELCLYCRQQPKHVDKCGKLGDFCSKTCRDTVRDAAPMILEVPYGSQEFLRVFSLFRAGWRHPLAEKPFRGDVMKVFKVYSHRDHMHKFKKYSHDKGNTVELWHGTSRLCGIGNTSGDTRFCGHPKCALCSILKNSFRVDMAKKSRQSFQRFGSGIYTSSTSSKAADYAKQRIPGPESLILSEVTLGRICVPTHKDTTLTDAPRGFDSVVGQPNLTVNYDEAVVYKNRAIRPKYLVTF